jgi:hypothetical protein
MNKIEPAVQTLSFVIPLPAGNSNNFIDLSQVASLVNRRFYRQGINWAVAGFKFLTNAGDVGGLTVQKLPNTWVMSNAWEKGFRAWQKMNDMALEETPSVRPRFLDYKVYADSSHHVAGFGGNLLPIVFSGGAAATPGEWEASKYVIPRSDSTTGVPSDREIIATGANYPGAGASGFNAVSLIEGYASSRGLPNVLDPNTPDDAADASGVAPQNWMTALFNEGTEQDETVLEDMIAENNIAPYPFENDGVNVDTMYPGGANQLSGLQIHDISNVSTTTVGGTTRLKGGNFPCGLIKITASNWSQVSTITLTIDLVPGNHRGYLCEPMTEM